ncbi:unknown [Bacteroides intestinalis CAG:564]|nr:unknown [Bacteroides intestinalis CAG:564]
MGDGGDEGGLGRVQLLKLGDILQQDDVTQVLRFVRIGFRVHNRDIGRLKIALLVVRIDFQRFLLFTGSDEFAHQTAEQVVLQREFFGGMADNLFPLQVKHGECLFVDEKYFMLPVQADDRLVNTVHDGFQKLLGSKNIVQCAGTVFRQPFRHAVEAIGHCAELFVPAHVEAFLVIVIGYFEDAVRQFLNRLTDGTGQPDQQHDTGKNTDASGNGNPQQSTLQTRHGGRAVRFGGCQYLKIHYGESNQQNDHTSQNAYTEY